MVPEQELIDREEHYEVEAILDSQLFQNKLQGLVAWKGYGYEENTWANVEDVNAEELIQEFYCARQHVIAFWTSFKLTPTSSFDTHSPTES
jgi:hypothetical protein